MQVLVLLEVDVPPVVDAVTAERVARAPQQVFALPSHLVLRGRLAEVPRQVREDVAVALQGVQHGGPRDRLLGHALVHLSQLRKC